MAYCTKCGTEHAPEDDFCPGCGAELNTIPGENGGPSGDSSSPNANDAEGRQPEYRIQDRKREEETWLTRRKMLLGGVLVVGGGTAYLLNSSGKPEHSVYGEGWDTTTDTGSRSQTVTGTLRLPEGRYGAWSFSPQVGVDLRIEFSVTSGSGVDAHVLSKDEYNRYRDREDFQLFTDLSITDSMGATLSSTVPAGDYRIVFDNTGVFGANPTGEVLIDFSFTSSY